MTISQGIIKRSLQQLLSNLIDYAGLFPPAQLPLQAAVQNYAQYRQGPDRWMLGRFIIPAQRLNELSMTAANSLNTEGPFAFSIIGASGKDEHDFLANLNHDIEAIAQFTEQHEDRAQINVFEVRFPLTVLDNPERAKNLLREMQQRLQRIGSFRIFIEPPLSEHWLRHVSAVVEAASKYGAGFKLRCGGTTAAAFPTPTQMVHAILSCHCQNIPMKFTAGLHHPICRFDASVNAAMYGFLNVFAAGLLVDRLSDQQLETILTDENPNHFVFDEHVFAWATYAVPTEKIAQLRQDFLLSYGSCSFDEPRGDLRALNLL